MFTMVVAIAGRILLKRPFDTLEAVILACCGCTEIAGALGGYLAHHILHETKSK